MPWQRLVADTACEIDPDTGYPAYREVVVTVPRQSGKTTLFLSWQIHRCLSPRWQQPQRSVFTAQTGKDARDKWLDELYPLIKGSSLARFTTHMHGGMGNESIGWATGGLIRLLSTSSSSGHSKTLHQAVMDEIWHDVDDRREQGLRPSMVTIPDAQLLVCSTAGTDASLVYNRKLTMGRQAVLADAGHGVAYIEYRAPDDWDPEDEESYFTFMPALCPDPPCRCGVDDGGWRHTVTLPVLRAERQSMDPPEYRRAYGNIPTASSDLVFAPEVWREVCDPRGTPGEIERFGLDVAEDRSSASIVAAGDGEALELVEHFPHGLERVAGRCNELTDRHGGKVTIDFGGPAGALADDIQECERLTGRDVIQACQSMYDAIVERRAMFRATPEPGDPFTDAAYGAVKKPMGDNFVWSRKDSVNDVTPLMAASLAWRDKGVGAFLL
jgi:hypothetical protein